MTEHSHVTQPNKKEGGWKKFVPHFAVIAILFLVVGFLAASAVNAPTSTETPTLTPTIIPTKSNVNEEELKISVQEFVNTRLLVGTGAEGVISAVKKGENAYELTLNIMQEGNLADTVTIYASFDGTTLYTAAFDLNEPLPSPQPTKEPEVIELVKSEKPVAEMFVMSYCPYGTQFEKAALPVIDLLGDKVDFELKFVSYAMHAEKEIVENTRQYCVQQEYDKAKMYNYLACFLKEDESEACLAELELDAEKIDSCINATHEEFEVSMTPAAGQRYPAYPIHAEDNTKYGVGGSPTFVLNGKVMQVNRSPEAIKQAICSAFIEPPEECNEALSEEGVSPGFGYEGGGSLSAGSCA